MEWQYELKILFAKNWRRPIRPPTFSLICIPYQTMKVAMEIIKWFLQSCSRLTRSEPWEFENHNLRSIICTENFTMFVNSSLKFECISICSTELNIRCLRCDNCHFMEKVLFRTLHVFKLNPILSTDDLRCAKSWKPSKWVQLITISVYTFLVYSCVYYYTTILHCVRVCEKFQELHIVEATVFELFLTVGHPCWPVSVNQLKYKFIEK